MRGQPWRTADVDPDAHYERQLCRYENEQDRLAEQAEELERQYEAALDDPRGIGDGLGFA